MSNADGKEEDRVHARLHISTDVSVRTGERTVPATLRDLSKGGARLHAREAIGDAGTEIEVVLPGMAGEDVAVMGTIVRVEAESDGLDVGVRFDAVDPAKERSLLELIDHLLSLTGGGSRKHPRVARRLAIRHGADLPGLLECVSRGGMEMTVAAPLVLFEEISVAVPDSVGDELLILRGRVVQQRPVADPQQPSAPPRWAVGIEFADLRPEARQLLDALLAHLLAASHEKAKPAAPTDEPEAPVVKPWDAPASTGRGDK